jgi:hypothetical protein
MQLFEKYRHHSTQIKHPQTDEHLNKYISAFYNLSYQYDKISDYDSFFGFLADEMKSYLFSKINIDVAKAHGLHNEMYALYLERFKTVLTQTQTAELIGMNNANFMHRLLKNSMNCLLNTQKCGILLSVI